MFYGSEVFFFVFFLGGGGGGGGGCNCLWFFTFNGQDSVSHRVRKSSRHTCDLHADLDEDMGQQVVVHLYQ